MPETSTSSSGSSLVAPASAGGAVACGSAYAFAVKMAVSASDDTAVLRMGEASSERVRARARVGFFTVIPPDWSEMLLRLRFDAHLETRRHHTSRARRHERVVARLEALPI